MLGTAGVSTQRVWLRISVLTTSVNERAAGVGSTFPSGSVAWTSKLWAPVASTPIVKGEVQGANAAAPTRHVKLDPGSLEENPNVGVESVVLPDGPLSASARTIT